MTTDDKVAALRTIKEAASYLSVSESTIRRMIRRGDLPARKVGSQIRLSEADLRPSERVDDYVAESDAFPVPEWAKERVARWRLALARLITAGLGVQVIVVDRRGSKAFEVLRPPGFRWGVNLWHSDGLELLTTDELTALFRGKKIYIFDEMVQRGRDLQRIKAQLDTAGLSATSVCLVRRRSAFLDGELTDPDVLAVEDLADRDFHDAAAFLSRLFDYCEPPLDPEHILVSGPTGDPNLPNKALDLLAGFGATGVVWNKFSREDATIAAITVDRPTFFDPSEIKLPEGLAAVWDGPCKARPYIAYETGHVTCAFICYPTLVGNTEAWQRLIHRVNRRYSEAADLDTDDLADLRDSPHITRAYLDVCTDISVQMLRQAVAAGFLTQLGMKRPTAPHRDQLAAFFGRRRAIEISGQIEDALAEPLRIMLPKAGAIAGAVDVNRSISVVAQPVRARRAILELLPHQARDGGGSRGITYRELIEATRPIDESAVSLALDGLIDGVDTKPVDVISEQDGNISVARAYFGSEYSPELVGVSAVHTYDVVQQKRTQAVAVLALSTWLEFMGLENETEITVAKLMVNLTWDWGKDLPPLAINPYPYKHGFVPALRTDAPYIGGERRLLLRELVDARLFAEESQGRNRRYRVSQKLNVATFLESSNLSGRERGQIRGLVRAYATIQKNVRLVRPTGPNKVDSRLFADPLIALSSARNEGIAYRAALFEVGDWIRIGRKTFRLLDGLQPEQSCDPSFKAALAADVVEFAQAARFLFTKVSMYDSMPQLHAGLKELCRKYDLDLAEILFDTIDANPRFETSYAISKTPVGLARRACEVLQPMSSLVRSALSRVGLADDTRKPEDRIVTNEDGEVQQKDVAYYANRLVQALRGWDTSHRASQVAGSIGQQAMAQQPSRATIVRQLAELFDLIVGRVMEIIPDESNIQNERAREDKRRGDLIKIARELDSSDLVGRGGFIAVGDFYNYVGMVRQLASIFGESEAAIGERVQDWIQEHIDVIAPDFPNVQWRVAADNCVIAGPDADTTMSAVMRLNELLHTRVEEYDRDQARLVGWMRFGIDRIGAELFSSLIVAYRLSDGLSFQRGTVAMTEAVVDALASPLPDLQAREVPGEDTIWLYCRPSN